MNLSEPRDGGSSSSCLVVWADDGSLAISLFFILYFPKFRYIFWRYFFTSHLIQLDTTKYIVTVLRSS